MQNIPEDILDRIKEAQSFWIKTIDQLDKEPDQQRKEFALLMTYIERLQKTLDQFKDINNMTYFNHAYCSRN